MYKLKLLPFVLLVVLLSSCAPILATPSPAPASPNATPVLNLSAVEQLNRQRYALGRHIPVFVRGSLYR